MDFLKKLAKWSPLALLYVLFDKSGGELGKTVAGNLKARFDFAKDKAGFYATRALVISLGLLFFAFFFYASQWHVLSVLCSLILAAGYIVSLIIIKAAIPKGKKESWGGIINVLLYAIFLVFVVLPLAQATILMPWNGLTVIPLFFFWTLAVVAYATILGGPISPKPLKVIMIGIAVIGVFYTLFLSTGAVGDALERFRVSYQLRVAAFFSSLSKGMDEGESPYDPVLYRVIRKGAPVYGLRIAFGKVVSAEPTANPADEDTVALATNVPFIKGLQELAIVQFADTKTGQYIGGKESWVGIARQDLVSLKSLQTAQQQAQQSALAAQQAARQRAIQDSLAQYQQFVAVDLATAVGDSVFFRNPNRKEVRIGLAWSGGERGFYFVFPHETTAALVCGNGPASQLHFSCPAGVKIEKQSGKKNEFVLL